MPQNLIRTARIRRKNESSFFLGPPSSSLFPARRFGRSTSRRCSSHRSRPSMAAVMRDASCDVQRATCNMRCAKCNMRTGNMQHVDIRHAACNIRHAARNMQRAACMRECAEEEGSCCSEARGPVSRRRTSAYAERPCRRRPAMPSRNAGRNCAMRGFGPMLRFELQKSPPSPKDGACAWL